MTREEATGRGDAAEGRALTMRPPLGATGGTSAAVDLTEAPRILRLRRAKTGDKLQPLPAHPARRLERDESNFGESHFSHLAAAELTRPGGGRRLREARVAREWDFRLAADLIFCRGAAPRKVWKRGRSRARFTR